MANHGPFCKRIKNDKEKNLQINDVEETENVKWCVFRVPQYVCICNVVSKFVATIFQFNNTNLCSIRALMTNHQIMNQFTLENSHYFHPPF